MSNPSPKDSLVAIRDLSQKSDLHPPNIPGLNSIEPITGPRPRYARMSSYPDASYLLNSSPSTSPLSPNGLVPREVQHDLQQPSQPPSTTSSSSPPSNPVPASSLPPRQQITYPKFTSLRALFVYALRSFGSSFAIGYGLRSVFSLILRIIRLARTTPRDLLSIDKLFREDDHVHLDAVRLGLFFGGFSGLFELVFHLLRKLRGVDDGVNSAIAGGVAGLSILFQRSDSRRTLGLYLMARVAQVFYNAMKERGVVSPLPFGDSLLFAFSSAVVMYAYVLRPAALPPSFYLFILRTGPIAPVVLEAVRHTTGRIPFNPESLKLFIRKNWHVSPSYPSTTPFTVTCPPEASSSTVASILNLVESSPSTPSSTQTVAGVNPSSAFAWNMLIHRKKEVVAKAVKALKRLLPSTSLVNKASLATSLSSSPSTTKDIEALIRSPQVLGRPEFASGLLYDLSHPDAVIPHPTDSRALLSSLLQNYIGTASPSTVATIATTPIPSISSSQAVSTAKFTKDAAIDSVNAINSLSTATLKSRPSTSPSLPTSLPQGPFAWPPGSCAHSFARVPCFALHPQVPHSCTGNFLRVFVESSLKTLPLYSSLTFVPLLVFKNLRLLSNPLKYLTEATFSLTRSLFFIGSFTAVYQGVICSYRNLTPHTAAESKFILFFAGVVCGFISILFERKTRRSELALYVLPRAVDALVYILRTKRLLPGPIFGSMNCENVLMWCTATSVLGYYFVHEPQHMSSLVYTIMSYLFGRDPLADKARLEQQQKEAAECAQAVAESSISRDRNEHSNSEDGNVVSSAPQSDTNGKRNSASNDASSSTSSSSSSSSSSSLSSAISPIPQHSSS